MLTASSAVAAPPPNDNFAAAEVLTGLPVEDFDGTNVDATKETGEPNHAGDAGGHSVWFSWTAPSLGEVVIQTCNSSLDSTLAVYTQSGAVPPFSNLSLVASDNGSCASGIGGKVRFIVGSGTTYKIAVDGFGGETGQVVLNIDATPANNDFAGAKVLTGLPASSFESNRAADKEAGEPNHAGDPGGASLWYSWTAPSSQVVMVDTCLSSPDTLLAVYTQGGAVPPFSNLSSVAFNDDTTACGLGSASLLTFPAVSGTAYKIAVDANLIGLGGGGISLEINPLAPNDAFANAQVLTGLPTSVVSTNRGSTKESGEPNHAGDAGGASVWFSWTAPSSGDVVIDTCDTDTDIFTLLGVYTQGGAVPPFSNLAEIASDQNSGCGLLGSVAAFTATMGTTYLIAVDGLDGIRGAFKLKIRGPPANDDVANAQVLTGPSASASGTNVLANIESVDEPLHAGNEGGASVWYSWTAPASGATTIDLCASDFDTILAVYRRNGAVPPFSNLTPTASDDDGCGGVGVPSKVTFTATMGATYLIAVDGFNEGSGPATGSVELALGPAVQQPPPPPTPTPQVLQPPAAAENPLCASLRKKLKKAKTKKKRKKIRAKLRKLDC